MTNTTYCRLCGKPSGEGHESWCPSNDDITHNITPRRHEHGARETSQVAS